MPNSPRGMGDAIIRNLPAKTGKSLEEWLTLIRSQGLETEKDAVAWMTQVHGVGSVTARMVAWEAFGAPDYITESGETLLAGQYAGAKATLLPIYEALARAVRELGPDAELEQRKTYTSLTRKKLFGMIQPSTRTRVDLGVKLPGAPETPRLRHLSPETAQATHVVGLTSPEEVDAEVRGWLTQAYQAAAK